MGSGGGGGRPNAAVLNLIEVMDPFRNLKTPFPINFHIITTLHAICIMFFIS